MTLRIVAPISANVFDHHRVKSRYSDYCRYTPLDGRFFMRGEYPRLRREVPRDDVCRPWEYGLSGPKAIEYDLVSALLDTAWGAYQASRQRRYEEAYREQAAADERARERQALAQRREEERRAREEARARAERAAELMGLVHVQERRLKQTLQLAEEARKRHPQAVLEVPGMPAPVSNPQDPTAVQGYLDRLEAVIRTVDSGIRQQAARAAGDQGLQALMDVLSTTVGGEPRSAAELLALYAAQVRVLARPAASLAMDRQETAERILGRLSGLDEAEIPIELDVLMRKLIEAPSDERAEMLALELRAQVQRTNEAREQALAQAQENRKREIAGVLVAEVLSDLGYEVEPIAETLFVSGGVAHFQRAEWGDYYVRMRVDPATRNINFNMVRTSESVDPPDAGQRKRDEEMEATWCAGMPKLLGELAARGIDARRIRELDAGAVPVQVVKPETVDPDLRAHSAPTQAASAPREMARPLRK